MTERRVCLAIGPHCWGKGATREQAIRRARREKPTYLTGRVKWQVWEVDSRAYVDWLGGIVSPDGAADPVEVTR